MWSGFGATLSSQDPPCHLLGAEKGDHAGMSIRSPPHSHPSKMRSGSEEMWEWVLGVEFLSFRYVWKVCVAQIAEQIKRSLFSV